VAFHGHTTLSAPSIRRCGSETPFSLPDQPARQSAAVSPVYLSEVIRRFS